MGAIMAFDVICVFSRLICFNIAFPLKLVYIFLNANFLKTSCFHAAGRFIVRASSGSNEPVYCPVRRSVSDFRHDGRPAYPSRSKTFLILMWTPSKFSLLNF